MVSRRRVLILGNLGRTLPGGEFEQVTAVQDGWLALVAQTRASAQARRRRHRWLWTTATLPPDPRSTRLVWRTAGMRRQRPEPAAGQCQEM
jgi:hypothetical protein